MKLIFAVIQGRDAERLLGALSCGGFRATQINSAGGFLRESNVTMLVGVDEAQVPELHRIIQANCYTRTQYMSPLMPVMEPGEFYMPSPIEVQIGGAAVFMFNVVRYERIVVD